MFTSQDPAAFLIYSLTGVTSWKCELKWHTKLGFRFHLLLKLFIALCNCYQGKHTEPQGDYSQCGGCPSKFWPGFVYVKKARMITIRKHLGPSGFQTITWLWERGLFRIRWLRQASVLLHVWHTASWIGPTFTICLLLMHHTYALHNSLAPPSDQVQ